jgi:hypothetical protein
MFTKPGSGQISEKGGQVVRTAAAAAGAFQQQRGEDFDRLAPKRIPLLCSQLLVQPAFRPQCVCELGCGLHSYLMQEKKTDSRVFQSKLRVHKSRNAAYLDRNQSFRIQSFSFSFSLSENKNIRIHPNSKT